MRTELLPHIAVYVICLALTGHQATGQVRGTGGGVVGGGFSGGQGGRGGGGNAGAGLGSNPGNQVEQLQQGAGTVEGNERFVRENRDPTAFVGADSADVTNVFTQQNGAFRSTQGAVPARGAANRNIQNFASQQQTRGRILRRRMHVGFQYPTMSPTGVTQNLNTQFQRILATKFPVANVQVAMQGRTAILRGSVASRDEMALVIQLAKLEPGVSQVRNELTVDAVANSTSRESERVLSTSPAVEANTPSPAEPGMLGPPRTQPPLSAAPQTGQ